MSQSWETWEFEVTALGATMLMAIRACRPKYLELGPKRDARVMSSQASFLVIRALKPLLSVPLWTQERSSLEPHLHRWMRVQLSRALGRTLAQAGRVSAVKGRQEWCWGRRPYLTDLSPPRNSGPHSGQ